LNKEHKKKEKEEPRLYTSIKVFLVCFPRIEYCCEFLYQIDCVCVYIYIQV
jgi:hypothetical protein